VILFLNGLGENGDDGLRHVSRNFGPQIWPMRDRFPFLAVAYQCPTGGSWQAGSPEAERVLKILDEAIVEHGGDPDRVILTGCSAGGFGVWSIASKYPDRFAAIVPLCGSGGADSATLVNTRVPIWNFYNEGDAKGLVAYNRSLREELLKAGASPLVTEYRRGGHRCWDRAYVTPALFAWMLEQNRTAHAKDSRFQFLPADAVLGEWKSHGTASWTINKQNELVSAASNENAPAYLASAEVFDDVEFHLDARFDPMSDCRIGLISEGESEQPKGYVLTLVDPRRGESSLSTADGEWLTSFDPAGQDGLLASDWNDVRIERTSGRLMVAINGWKSLVFTEDALRGTGLRLALFASGDESKSSFRYLRFRERKSSSPNATPSP
jgi:pimeloyl-ACP methyl ester carboxylesterase